MSAKCNGSRFVILSLPRCGSTTLARLLNAHEHIRCLIEPFHPRRYDGRFHRLATSRSVDCALELIWTKWNGIKHVWEAGGWPFPDKPEMNDRIALSPERKIVVLVRRNLLRRVISNLISRQTGYWIGNRAEFRDRLNGMVLRRLEPELVRRQIQCDRDAVCRHLRSLADSNARVLKLDYEDLFREDEDTSDRMKTMNRLLEFLEFSPVTEVDFARHWARRLDPAEGRWASDDVYRKIPNIEAIEEAAGCDETGWLFR